MSYVPGVPPASLSTADIMAYVQQELEAIARATRETTDLIVAPLHVEPVKPRDGLLVLADGTDWDPGSGEGAYVYYAGVWNFLG